MRHVPDGRLRRILDAPLAVADRDTQHVGHCTRCNQRAQQIAENATAAHRLFDTPLLNSAGTVTSQPSIEIVRGARPTIRVRRNRHWRLMGVSFSTGASIAAAGVVLAGVAAAATLTTVFAPTQVAPLQVSTADMQEFTQVMGLTTDESLGGFSSPSGSETLPFGTLRWTSSGGPVHVATLADGESATGLSMTLPTSLPNGVGTVARYVVLSKVTVMINFNASAGTGLSGSKLVATLGPAIGVTYNSVTTGEGINPLVIATAAAPSATSTGATTTEIESFLLSRPGMPGDLGNELRLLGDLQHTLPIPTPPGAVSETTTIGGSPAVVLSDPSDVVSGAIWESQSSVIHAVAGLLDKGDLLHVAQQIG